MNKNKNIYARHRRRKRRRSFWSPRRLLMLFFALITAIGALSLADYAVKSIRRKHDNSQLAQEFSEAFAPETTPEPTAAPQIQNTPEPTAAPQLPQSFRSLSGSIPQQARRLYQQNNDLVGWLYIRSVVDLPVVYRDNDYYLDHDFSGKKNSGGTLFLDQYHPLSESTQNLVIHGHNMYDSSMFGIVSNYNELNYVKNHPFARFSTMYAPEEYVIFAVLRVNPDVQSPDYFSYTGKAQFSSTNQFYNYVEALKDRSLFEIPIDIQPSDALLTLSTCIDDDRLAVVFRRIRSGETKTELQALAQQAKRKS